MAIRDHQTRVAKHRVQISVVDPSQRIIEVVDKTGYIRRLTVFEVPSNWTWPKPREDWSIYEENGTWVLGNKFLDPEEAKLFEAQQPGDQWPIPESPGSGFEVIGFPNDDDLIVFDIDSSAWVSSAPFFDLGISNGAYNPLITFVGNWSIPAGWSPPFITRTVNHMLYWRGVVTNSNMATAAGTTIFNMPLGWRIGPWGQRFICPSVDITSSESGINAASDPINSVILLMKSNGDLIYLDGGIADSNGDISFYLTGITYRAIT